MEENKEIDKTVIASILGDDSKMEAIPDAKEICPNCGELLNSQSVCPKCGFDKKTISSYY